MKVPPRTYLPAAGHDWLLPLYDPMVSLFGGDAARQALLDQVTLRSNDHLLDIGCGTGTLMVLIKRLHPGVEVVGLDPDPKALARGGRKAVRAAVSIRFDQGYSDELPYAAASFDRVLSSFVFHHLPPETMERTLREVRRVLVPGGSLHVLDFAAPTFHPGSLLLRLFHSSERMKGKNENRTPSLLKEAGFADAKEVGRRPTLLRPIAYYQATAPASEVGTA